MLQEHLGRTSDWSTQRSASRQAVLVADAAGQAPGGWRWASSRFPPHLGAEAGDRTQLKLIPGAEQLFNMEREKRDDEPDSEPE